MGVNWSHSRCGTWCVMSGALAAVLGLGAYRLGMRHGSRQMMPALVAASGPGENTAMVRATARVLGDHPGARITVCDLETRPGGTAPAAAEGADPWL